MPPYLLLPFSRPSLPSPPRPSTFPTLPRHIVPRSLQHMTFLHHHRLSDINHPVCSTAHLCSLSCIWFVHTSLSTSRHRHSQWRKITPSVLPTKGHRRKIAVGVPIILIYQRLNIYLIFELVKLVFF